MYVRTLQGVTRKESVAHGLKLSTGRSTVDLVQTISHRKILMDGRINVLTLSLKYEGQDMFTALQLACSLGEMAVNVLTITQISPNGIMFEDGLLFELRYR